MDKKEEILKVLSVKLRRLLENARLDYEKLKEIRLRVNRPMILFYGQKEYFLGKDSALSEKEEEACLVTANEMQETMEYISNYSLYAFEEEIRQGFITIQGGHRVGVAGKIILENHRIKNMKHISFINIRLSHQIKGCADRVLPYIRKEESIYHTLIISPPGGGKTTLLRDMIRQLSNGSQKKRGITVGVVDERSELGACYMGIPQNDLGIRTDILDCCPKAEGMLLLVRSMSPAVIAVDEIGFKEDIEAIEYALNCGCKLLATVHGTTIDDILNKPYLGKMVRERTFERFIFLSCKTKAGKIEDIYDERGNLIYEG